MNTHHPFHPIIYLRGFAASANEVDQAVSDPYMGFNLGSTKTRKTWSGKIKKFYFESPMIRLQSDHNYGDVYVKGSDVIESPSPDIRIPYRSVVIHRYYDEASEAFGTENDGIPLIQYFASELGKLIIKLRDIICSNPDNGVTPDVFRVYLVAHSMGGLICRCLLQNKRLGADPDYTLSPKEQQDLSIARSLVDKLYTYATPHNGIDLRIVRNIPAWRCFGEATTFNRERMAHYLGLPAGASDVSDLGEFPADRVFNLVGTNSHDYTVLGGLSAWAVGEDSDGLVRIENATTHGRTASGVEVSSPRAFIHRSHSGHYGIVNSEEGYQNLVRFLFGNLRVDGILDIDQLILPADIQQKFDNLSPQDRHTFKASYQFEVSVGVRGCQWLMHQRNVREHSAIFRTYEQLFPLDSSGVRTPDRAQSPHLFSAYLDQRNSVKPQLGSVSLAFDLSLRVPDYTFAGIFWNSTHYENSRIFDTQLVVEAIPDADDPMGWRIEYEFREHSSSDSPQIQPNFPLAARAQAYYLPNNQGLAFKVPIIVNKRPGIQATLRVEARPWN